MEVMTHWNNCREEVEDFFKTMDRDFDQKLSFGEFMGEESHIEKIFKSMDTNNDGYVTKQVELILTSHTLTQCVSGIQWCLQESVRRAGFFHRICLMGKHFKKTKSPPGEVNHLVENICVHFLKFRHKTPKNIKIEL